MLRTAALATLLFVPFVARADMLPEGYKGVKLSIHVDATVPAGKALILDHTFRGADVIVPGTTQQVEWHPLGGPMQLRLIPADKTKTIETARTNLDRDAVRPIADAGAVCHEPFQGVRTIPDTSPAEEVRWTYRVTVDGDKCTAELVHQQYLSKTGEVVEKPADPNAIPPPTPIAPPAPPAPTKVADAKTDAPAKTDAAPTKTADSSAPKAAGCGCDVDGQAPGLAALALVGLALRRRRAGR
jgi:MYXO-CTERM domain-containing protein